MGAVMHSIWIGYAMRVMEPELWSEENVAKGFEKEYELPEQYLSEREKLGGEDESFREHVRQHINKWNDLDDDPYWNFDKRIHTWINKVFESKIPKA
jgi:hypothetical protein